MALGSNGLAPLALWLVLATLDFVERAAIAGGPQLDALLAAGDSGHFCLRVGHFTLQQSTIIEKIERMNDN